MRNSLVILVILILVGCVKHHAAQEFDLDKVEEASLEILESDIKTIQINELPSILSELEPIHVRIDKTGVFIQLDNLFASESGLFISRDNFVPETSAGVNPSFRLLKNRAYSYVIKG